jgi:hypothetical protein
MTDEQINAAIAKATDCAGHGNYTHDLNSMHEVEKTLKGYDQIHTYVWHLENRDDWHTDLKLMVAHATARQRAEAFLRTLGKWEERTK